MVMETVCENMRIPSVKSWGTAAIMTMVGGFFLPFFIGGGATPVLASMVLGMAFLFAAIFRDDLAELTKGATQ